MFKVAIDVRVLDRKMRTGIERYTYNLVEELAKLNDFTYYLMGEFSDIRSKNVRQLKIDLPHSDVEQSEKFLALKGYIENISLLFSPYYPIPKRRTFKGVLTIHDLIPLRFPEFFASSDVFDYINKEIRESAKYVDHIIADSESTKNDIINFYSIDENKISVVYLAADNSIKVFNDREHNVNIGKFSRGFPYILSVCTIEPRKNLSRTIKAFEHIRGRFKERIKLILVGKLGWKYNNLMKQISDCKYKEDIVLTGYVTDEELAILYKNAEVFVYPSLYEGFGLPVLEAMGCGTPVVTSNVSSLPEVGGDAVLYCNPYDVESIAYGIEQILMSATLQKQLREKGLERSKLFSWEKTAQQTRDVFLKCLNES